MNVKYEFLLIFVTGGCTMHSEQSFHILTSIKIGNITKSILFYFNMIRLNELEKSIR